MVRLLASRWCRLAAAAAFGYAIATSGVAASVELLADADGPLGYLTAASADPGAMLPRRPAALLVHDTLGIDGRAAPYVAQLEGAGFLVLEMELHALSLDGAGTLDDAPAGAAEAAKVLRAAEALARHPAVDPRHLAAVGFGAGGRAVALAVPENGAPDPFSARVLLYPGCSGLLEALSARAPALLPRSAMLLLHGEANAANTPGACDSIAGVLRPMAPAARVKRYRAATYGWDVLAPAGREASRQPRPDGAGSVPTWSWPGLAEMSAAQTTGFVATVLSALGE
jgi:dienelactone hydrolase